MTKIVAFDFDGVIFDSTLGKTLAFKDVYKNRTSNENVQKIVSYHKENMGINRIKKFQYFEKHILGNPYNENDIDQLCHLFKKRLNVRLSTANLLPGVHDFLKSLSSKNFKLLIVSGAPSNEILSILKKYNLDLYFEKIYDGEKSKIEHFQNIIEQYMIRSSDIIFIGDAMTDLKAAKKWNIPFVSVNANFAKQESELIRASNFKELNSKIEEFINIFRN